MCDDYLDALVAMANNGPTVPSTPGGSGDGNSEDMMPLADIYGIFSNIREIYKSHARFFNRIKVR